MTPACVLLLDDESNADQSEENCLTIKQEEADDNCDQSWLSALQVRTVTSCLSTDSLHVCYCY